MCRLDSMRSYALATSPSEAAYLVLLGLFFGIAASVLTGHLLRNLLFGVRSWDLSILTRVPATLAVATLIATWVPARRACRRHQPNRSAAQ